MCNAFPRQVETIVNKYKCPTRLETCSAITLRKNKPDKPIADGFRSVTATWHIITHDTIADSCDNVNITIAYVYDNDNIDLQKGTLQIRA